MSEKIIDALNKLDVTNDNHWTAEGMPRLETLQMLSGNSKLTRDDIVRANPGFSRSSFAQNGPIIIPQPKLTGAIRVDGSITTIPETVPKPIAENSPIDKLKTAQEQLARLDKTLNDAKRARDEQQKIVDKLLVAHEKENPVHSYEATRGYLENQKVVLEQRAERVRAVRESGVDLKALMASVAKSPLDMAMARKNGRGTNRPGVKK